MLRHKRPQSQYQIRFFFWMSLSLSEVHDEQSPAWLVSTGPQGRSRWWFLACDPGVGEDPAGQEEGTELHTLVPVRSWAGLDPFWSGSRPRWGSSDFFESPFAVCTARSASAGLLVRISDGLASTLRLIVERSAAPNPRDDVSAETFSVGIIHGAQLVRPVHPSDPVRLIQ